MRLHRCSASAQSSNVVYTISLPLKAKRAPEYQGLPSARFPAIRLSPLDASLLARENPLQITILPIRCPRSTAPDLETGLIVVGAVFPLIETGMSHAVAFTTALGAVLGLRRSAGL